MNKNNLKLTILDQRKAFERRGEMISRDMPKSFIQTKKITAISGVRRSGKSTLLKQLSDDYPDFYYLNFEDERLLSFEAADFNNLYELFLSIYGEQKVFFFDEIQNVFGWEKFVNRLFAAGYKIFITGSNAKLLSSELATALSGRHLKIELYPFSFKEFLAARKFSWKSFYDTEEKARLMSHFEEYLNLGGFPEVVISKNEEELKQLYQDILIKDLIVRFKIKEVKAFRELALFVLSNTGSKISFNNLKTILEFKSVTSVKNYIEFLETSYLNFLISKFDFSLKKQMINNKKVYSIDTGLINFNSFSFSKNSGKLLENLVFIELKRRNEEIYYYQATKECDFLIRKGRKIEKAIQVTENLRNENRDRELSGLKEAGQTFSLKEGLLLTLDQEEDLIYKGFKVTILPVWKWLLS